MATATPTLASTATPSPTGTFTPTATATPATGIPDAPASNWDTLVREYLGRNVGPLPASTLYRNDPVGTKQTFWVLDLNGPKVVQVKATLQIVSKSALWYTADSLDVSNDALARTAKEFDNTIFPADRKTFAPDADIPGKITILNADIPGLGGYFASEDAQSTAAYPYSNQRAMIVMNGTGAVDSNTYLGTLAHEAQHLVYWLVDPTEESWISEGTAELAATSLGLPALPYSNYFNNPTVSLSSWPDDPNLALSAYAAASLFASYLASRTGLDNIHELVSEPKDGSAGVAAYLNGTIGESFGDFWGDWLVANLVGASSGKYAYNNGPPGHITPHLSLTDSKTVSGTVPQLGGTYVTVTPASGPLRISFDGTSTTPVLPVPAHSGDSCWWANRGDSMDSTLTREIDLTGIPGATLSFWGWYDIEENFDYAYVSISADGGATWQALKSADTTDANPVGSSLGNAFTGTSNGWKQETVDLTPYAGKRVLLRFEYVTDESVNNGGWCIDDLNIPQIGFSDDTASNTGWDANGFFLVTNKGIPQQFVVRTVQGSGNDAVVNDVHLDSANDASFTIGAATTIVIGALTERTPQPAAFTLTATHP